MMKFRSHLTIYINKFTKHHIIVTRGHQNQTLSIHFEFYISHPLANLLHGAGAGYMQVGVHVHANYVIHMYDMYDRPQNRPVAYL